MKIKRIAEYTCDAPHCNSKIKVDICNYEYGYRDEFREIEKRGWLTFGIDCYCRNHKYIAIEQKKEKNEKA